MSISDLGRFLRSNKDIYNNCHDIYRRKVDKYNYFVRLLWTNDIMVDDYAMQLLFKAYDNKTLAKITDLEIMDDGVHEPTLIIQPSEILNNNLASNLASGMYANITRQQLTEQYIYDQTTQLMDYWTSDGKYLYKVTIPLNYYIREYLYLMKVKYPPILIALDRIYIDIINNNYRPDTIDDIQMLRESGIVVDENLHYIIVYDI